MLTKNVPKVYVPFRHNSIFEGWDIPFVDSIYDCDVVILWNDVNFTERQVIKLAKSLGKKTVVMQHGRKGSSRYFPPFNEKIQADRLLVWGNLDKRALVGVGQNPSAIRVVGTTVLRGLPKRQLHKGINVVFCPEHWDKEVEENAWVKKELRKLKKKGINVITKIIESHNPKDYDNPIQSHRDSPEHLKICKEVLSTADLVVGISESTFELIAQAMDIPVVIMNEWVPKTFGGDERYLTYRRVVSQASKQSSLKDLNKTILEQLANPSELAGDRLWITAAEGGPINPMALIKQELHELTL